MRKPLVMAGLMLCACFPKAAPPPTALNPRQLELAKVKSPDVSEESLEAGRKLFVDKCGQCHDHPDLADFRLSKWPGALKKMIPEAELEKDQKASGDLSAFVLTAAEAAGARP